MLVRPAASSSSARVMIVGALEAAKIGREFVLGEALARPERGCHIHRIDCAATVLPWQSNTIVVLAEFTNKAANVVGTGSLRPGNMGIRGRGECLGLSADAGD